MQSTYFIIEHIPSGRIMPEVKTGYTYWKPYQKHPDRTAPIPRIFHTKRAAERSLVEYCKGELRIKFSGAGFEHISYRVRENPRNKQDYRVVPIEIILCA